MCACVCVYLSESKPLWMCLEFRTERNAIRNHGRRKIFQLNQTHDTKFSLLRCTMNSNSVLTITQTNCSNIILENDYTELRTRSAAIKMCVTKSSPKRRRRELCLSVHVSHIRLTWLIHSYTHFPFCKRTECHGKVHRWYWNSHKHSHAQSQWKRCSTVIQTIRNFTIQSKISPKKCWFFPIWWQRIALSNLCDGNLS